MLGLKRRARYRKFHYEPRYFDPQQEELKSRVEMKRFEEGKEVETKSHRERISRSYQYNKQAQKVNLNRMLRLGLIAGILLALLFVYDVPKLLINLFVK